MHDIRSFVSDERGAITIEFTVLVPFFIFLMIFFADACVIYLTHTEMNNVARDAARRMSTGELESEAEVVAYASERLYLGGRTYVVDVSSGGEIRVAVAVPMQQAVFFGLFFGKVLGESLVVESTVKTEPPLVEST